MKRKKKQNYTNNNYDALDGYFSPTRRELLKKDPSGLNVGERLRRERYLRAFTLEQMANYLGISTSYLGSMERGARPVSRAMMDKFHERLGLSYDYLWEGLNVTGTMITQYVRETSLYDAPIRHKIDVLLNVCSPEEEIACYNLIHTYLTQERNSKKNLHKSSESSESREKPKENDRDSSNFP